MIQHLKDYQLKYLRILTSEYKRYLHKDVDFSQKLIGIVGARGVGKTTFLLQYLKENSLPLSKKLYFSADAVDIESLFDIACKYLEYLKRGEILNLLRAKTKGDNIFLKPDKIYLGNTNLHYAYCNEVEIGTIREVFFMSMIDDDKLPIHNKADFIIDDKFIIEVGGKDKKFKQIKDIKNSFVVADDIEVGSGNKIPLWLFGFLY